MRTLFHLHHEEGHARWVVAMISVVSVFRICYALFVVDPLSGPDSDTYDSAARVLADEGPLAPEVPGIPYFPAGYPLFLSVFYRVVDDPRLATAVQVLLFGFATWIAYLLVRREFDLPVAALSTFLLCVSPGLFAASAELMYETMLGGGIVLGFDFFSRSVRGAAQRRIPLAAAGVITLSLAATIQPKVVVVALLAIAWFAIRTRHLLAVSVLVLALLVGPLALAARNFYAVGDFATSRNLGATMAYGMHDDATGGSDVGFAPPCAVTSIPVEERSQFKCSIRWAIENPLEATWLGLKKVMYFSSPLVGPLAGRGTWFHAFDFRRVLPDSLLEAMWYRNLEFALWNVWTAVWGLLVVGGAAIAARRYPRAGVWLFAIPILAFALVSMGTIGDGRFRLPVAPFYSAFIAVAIMAIVDRFRRPREGKPGTRSA